MTTQTDQIRRTRLWQMVVLSVVLVLAISDCGYAGTRVAAESTLYHIAAKAKPLTAKCTKALLEASVWYVDKDDFADSCWTEYDKHSGCQVVRDGAYAFIISADNPGRGVRWTDHDTVAHEVLHALAHCETGDADFGHKNTHYWVDVLGKISCKKGAECKLK